MATLPHERVGPGRKPALLIVDATIGFTDPRSPLGSDSATVMAAIKALLEAFRARGLPVVFTTVSYSHSTQASTFRRKLPLLNLLSEGSEAARIDPRIAPQPGEIVINKRVASAFFDSSLRQTLVDLGVDTTFVCGFTTSGCVRATAVDALQSNFRLIVVRDACGDRDPDAHAANLRDLDLKYGDVVALDEALTMLD